MTRSASVPALAALSTAVLSAAGADDASAEAATWAMLHASLHGVDSHGITRVDHGRYTRLDAANGALPSDILYSLEEDRDGSVWVATSHGLARIDDRGSTFFGRAAGLPEGAIVHLAMTASGVLLVGTENGAYRRVGNSGRFEPLSDQLPKDSVPSLAMDASGNAWIGTTNNGLYRLSSDRLEHFTSVSELPNNRIASLLVDREGTIWAGTNAGLLHLADTPFTSWGREQGLSDSYVRTLAPATGGGVWIGTGRGLNLLRDGQATGFFRDDLDAEAHARLALLLTLGYFAARGITRRWGDALPWRDRAAELIVRGASW